MFALTLVHILGGSAALVSGGAALSLRKGGRGHGRAGTVFFGGMLVLTSTGALMAALEPERGTMMIGLFTAYLVITSWAAARNRDGEAGLTERIALPVAIGCALALLSFGLLGAASPNGRFEFAAGGGPLSVRGDRDAGGTIRPELHPARPAHPGAAHRASSVADVHGATDRRFLLLPRPAAGDARIHPGLADPVRAAARGAGEMIFWIFGSASHALLAGAVRRRLRSSPFPPAERPESSGRLALLGGEASLPWSPNHGRRAEAQRREGRIGLVTVIVKFQSAATRGTRPRPCRIALRRSPRRRARIRGCRRAAGACRASHRCAPRAAA